jgi:hypothetical protein
LLTTLHVAVGMMLSVQQGDSLPRPVQQLTPLEASAARPRISPRTSTMSSDVVREADPTADLPVQLGELAGITVATDAGSGLGYGYFRIRGFDPARVLVTLDGLPVSEPEDYGFYSSNFPRLMYWLDQITLARGPQSSIGGAAGVGGTVALESRSPWREGLTQALEVDAGSFGTVQASALNRQQISSRWAVLAGANVTRTDGYRERSFHRGASGLLGIGGLLGRVAVRVNALVGTADNGMAWLPAAAEEANRNPRFNPLPSGQEDAFTQGIVSMHADLPTGSSMIGVALGGNWLGGRIDLPAEGPPALNLDHAWWQAAVTWRLDRVNARWESGVLGSWYAREHALLAAGSDEPDYHNRGRRDEFAWWGRGQWQFDEWDFGGEVQARWSHFAYEPVAGEAAAASIDWTFLNPQVWVGRGIGRAHRAELRAGVLGREPARSDLFAGADNVTIDELQELGGLEAVRPEHAFEVSVGIRSAAVGRNAWHWSAQAFGMWLRQEITPSGPLSPFGLPLRRNTPQSRRLGLETEGRWRNDSWTAAVAVMVLGARIEEWTDEATGTTVRDVRPLLTPPWTITTTVARRWRAIRTAIDVRLRGPLALEIAEQPQQLGAQAEIGARLQYVAGPMDFTMRLTNLLGSRLRTGGYVVDGTPYVFVGAPRAMSVGLAWRRP